MAKLGHISKNKIIVLTLIMALLLVICYVIGISVSKQRELQRDAENTASSFKAGKIDIGGYGLYAYSNGKGSPTVIFEAGLGSPYTIWLNIQKQISSVTKTFSYNRAGIELSDKSKLERTSLNEVKELHTLLENAKLKGPYIIVAHSLGGYNARLFAGTYPDEVAGIIFVDCCHENQFDADIIKDLPQEEKEGYVKMLARYGEQNLDEMATSSNQVKEIRKKDALRNIPITVITAEASTVKNSGATAYQDYVSSHWMDFQNDLASLSDKSNQIFVKGSGHIIMVDKPEVVINAIKDMIKEVRD